MSDQAPESAGAARETAGQLRDIALRVAGLEEPQGRWERTLLTVSLGAYRRSKLRQTLARCDADGDLDIEFAGRLADLMEAQVRLEMTTKQAVAAMCDGQRGAEAQMEIARMSDKALARFTAGVADAAFAELITSGPEAAEALIARHTAADPVAAPPHAAGLDI